MKAIQETAEFKPVTITIENIDELRYLKDMLQEYSKSVSFTNNKNFANALLALIEDMK